MELFSIPCPTCGARLKVKSLAAIGQIFNCPKCQSMVLVEPPAGWTPPQPESKAVADEERPVPKPRKAAGADAPSSAPVPDAIEPPVAMMVESPDGSLDSPPEVPWQSAAEARWRRGAWIGTAAVGVVMLAAGAWSVGSRGSSALIQQEPQAEPPPESPVAAVEEGVAETAPTPAPVDPPTPAEIAPANTANTLPRRWLPASARLVLSLPIGDLASHEEAPEMLASGGSPLRQPLAELRTTFRLLPEHIRRLTWVATDESPDLRHSLVVIDLSQPLEDDAALLAGCQRIDLHVAEAVCHQPQPGGWPHPFAIVDPSTIVTGPRELLGLIGGGDAVLDRPELAAALEAVSGPSSTMAIDLRPWPGLEQFQWTPSMQRLTALPTWPALGKLPQAAALNLDLSKPAADLHVVCASPQEARDLQAALQETLASINGVEDTAANDDLALLLKGWRPSSPAAAGPMVTWSAQGPDDGRLLAAAVVDFLPKWEAPMPPPTVAATPSDPMPRPTAAAPPPAETAAPAVAADTRTPFEQHVARRFDERIPAIVLRGMKLGEFTSFVSRMTGVVIAVDDEALRTAGIGPQSTVEIQLTAATIGEVFSAALAAHELGYIAQENRLLVTTRARAEAAGAPAARP